MAASEGAGAEAAWSLSLFSSVSLQLRERMQRQCVRSRICMKQTKTQVTNAHDMQNMAATEGSGAEAVC